MWPATQDAMLFIAFVKSRSISLEEPVNHGAKLFNRKSVD